MSEYLDNAELHQRQQHARPCVQHHRQAVADLMICQMTYPSKITVNG